jgi:hypothetical protein
MSDGRHHAPGPRSAVSVIRIACRRGAGARAAANDPQAQNRSCVTRVIRVILAREAVALFLCGFAVSGGVVIASKSKNF